MAVDSRMVHTQRVPPLPPDPTDLIKIVLESFFGPASIVVFCFALITVALAWVSVYRQSVSLPSKIQQFFQAIPGAFTDKVRAGVLLAFEWIVFYGIASVATQIVAGGEFSPGQGYGWVELATWSAIFGTVSFVGVVLIFPKGGNPNTILGGLFFGYVIGFIIAMIWFGSKGGPVVGDWWIAPASSCCIILVAVSVQRLNKAPV